jgi:hypothetical protein
MNSLGASGSRGSKHGSGSGSAKHGDKEVYSGVGERPGSEDASKDRTKLKIQSKSKVAKTPGKAPSREEEVKQAFAAMGRVRVREREPFISDESLIAAANDTTVVPEANSEDDCEITLEELAPKFPTGSQKFGHRGWIAGGEEEGEDGQEGDGAGENSPIIVSSQEKEKQLQATKTQGALRKQQAGKSPANALEQVKSSGGSAGRARKKNPDPFAIESELEEDPVEEENGGGGGKTPEALSAEDAGALSSGSQRGARTAKNPGKKRADERKRKEVKQVASASEEDGDGKEGEGVEEPGAAVSTQLKRAVHVPAFDERVPRSELKLERRAATRQRNDEVRRQAGADKRIQHDFDDVLDEIRMTNMLSVGSNELVCWSKKLALRACEAVHLTAARVACELESLRT